MQVSDLAGCMAMDLHIDIHEGRFIATTSHDWARSVGLDPDGAARLDRLVAVARPPPSPFATVRKRLGERHTSAAMGSR